MIVKFESTYIPKGDYVIRASKYPNRRNALVLHSTNGEPTGVLTVNLPQNPLRHDEVFVKNYSENEGVVDALVKAGVAQPPHRWVMSGFVQIPVCTLTKAGLELVTGAEEA
jgi:hypothetical protein